MAKVNGKTKKGIPATEDVDETKKEAEPKIPGQSHVLQEAAAEMVGDNIGALPAVEKKTPEKGELAKKVNEFDSSFGWVELQGKRYDFDIIVHVDGSVTKREKGLSKKKKEKYGHTPLTSKELKELAREDPAMLIIGTGHNGSMPLTPKAERFLAEYPSFVDKTPIALERLANCEEKVAALLHVTC